MLNLSNRFSLDIQGKETALTPLIVIDSSSINPIYISTIKQHLTLSPETNPVYWEDRDLNINSIKESINVSDKKFKISNLSFKLNNYEYNGTRFSDFVASQNGLLGKYVEVYYKTPSCQSLQDCLLIYRGIIKRFNHNSKECSIQLEDLTEDKLSKKIPIANTGFSSSVYNEDYKNIPIPMCYGNVDKAPAIPFKSQNEESNLIDISIIPDDVLSTEREIDIVGFGADESETFYLIDGQELNPLFLYKGDYFRALEKYDYSAIEEDSSGASQWAWGDYTQYVTMNNYVAIRKKYSGNTAINPPADNEMMCIKVRHPNNLKVLPNPDEYVEGELPQYQDTAGYGVHFIQKPVLSPELSHDNSRFILPQQYYLPNINKNYDATFASIPDTTVPSSDIDGLLYVRDFTPHYWGSNVGRYGIWNNEIVNTNYQFQVISHFMRYPHYYNQDHLNPVVSFVRMPSPEYVKEKLNKEIYKKYVSELILNNVPDGESTPLKDMSIYNDEVIQSALTLLLEGIDGGTIGYDIPTVVYGGLADGLSVRYNCGINLSKPMWNNWCEANNIGNPDYLWDAYNNSTNLWEFPSKESNYAEKPYSSGYLFTTDAPEYDKAEGASLKFPTAFMRFLITGASFSENPNYDVSTTTVTFQIIDLDGNTNTYSYNYRAAEIIGANFALCSLNTSAHNFDNMECGHYNDTYNSNCLYYNYWDTGDGYPHLGIDYDEFPIYSPVNNTYKTRDFPLLVRTKFNAVWNGTRVADCPDIDLLNNMQPSYNNYGGMFTPDSSYRVQEKHMHPHTGGGNSGWFMWIREDVQGVGDLNTSITLNDEHNVSWNSQITVPKNTLLPICYKANKSIGHDVLWQSYNLNEGTLITDTPDYVTVNSGESGEVTDQRLGLVFPFKDQEISDAIKTDTFFHGKVLCDVAPLSTGLTSDLGTYNFKVAFGAVDTTSEGIDWDVFDINLEETLLVEKSHSNILDSQGQIGYSTLDPVSSDENSSQLDFDNQFDGNFLRVPQFFTVDNYNALSLLFLSQPINDGTVSTGEEIVSFKTDIYNIGLIHYIVFSAALDSDFYLDVKGRGNRPQDTFVDAENTTLYKYTGELIGDEHTLIHRPSDIIYHILEKEIGLIDMVDYNSLQKCRIVQDEISSNLDFSLQNEKKTSDFIIDLCKSSNIIPLFKSTSEFAFASIKNTYGDSDVDLTIKAQDVIKYSFTRTPQEKTNTLVNVKYKEDYAQDEFTLETGYCDGYDFFGNQDSINREEYGSGNGFSYSYLGLEREDKVLEFEANYIRNSETAKKLRDYLFLSNCNQHNIFKLQIPLKYLNLEVGDIVKFDSLIEDVKAYGENYIEPTTRNGQTIYPYFIITSTDKKQKFINIEMYQLHKLQGDFVAHLGSPTRSLGIKNGFQENMNITLEDVDLIEDFVEGGIKYYTQGQMRASDLIGDGVINQHDVSEAESLLNPISSLNGDLNFDGVVNVIDIIALVSYITSSDSIDLENLFEAYDVNNDGIINIIDIIETVNTIIADGDEGGGDY